jgi:hypothetical protein
LVGNIDGDLKSGLFVTRMVIRKLSEDAHAKRSGRFLGPPMKNVKKIH